MPSLEYPRLSTRERGASQMQSFNPGHIFTLELCVSNNNKKITPSKVPVWLLLPGESRCDWNRFKIRHFIMCTLGAAGEIGPRLQPHMITTFKTAPLVWDSVSSFYAANGTLAWLATLLFIHLELVKG